MKAQVDFCMLRYSLFELWWERRWSWNVRIHAKEHWFRSSNDYIDEPNEDRAHFFRDLCQARAISEKFRFFRCFHFSRLKIFDYNRCTFIQQSALERSSWNDDDSFHWLFEYVVTFRGHASSKRSDVFCSSSADQVYEEERIQHRPTDLWRRRSVRLDIRVSQSSHCLAVRRYLDRTKRTKMLLQ